MRMTRICLGEQQHVFIIFHTVQPRCSCPMIIISLHMRSVLRFTKFELVDALPADGFAVVNNNFPYVANREVTNVECVRYSVGDENNGDYRAKNIQYSSRGTSFTIEGCGKSIDLQTKLVGECNISNLMAAVIVAMKLDVPEQKIKYAVSRIEQVEHRLNVKRTASGITIIDDAFNSNPDGSRMALDVLGGMSLLRSSRSNAD